MGPPRHASAQTSATAASGCPQAPGAAARLGVCATTAGGARPASSRDAAAWIAPIASGSSTVAISRSWADGTRHLIFEPLTLLEKLATLTPRPRINLVLYHGVLAPHAAWRARVTAYGTPPADGPASARASTNVTDNPAAAPAARWAWADLMRRAFEIDVLACPRCGGRLHLVATVEDPDAIRAILAAAARERVGRAPPFPTSPDPGPDPAISA